MIKLFFKIYTFIYIFYLKVFYHKQFEIHGRIKANRFFRIELSRTSIFKIYGDIDIKENVLFAIRKNATLIIGSGCFFNRNCSIIVRERVEIGNNCMFGENVKIYDNDHLVEEGNIYKDKYNTKNVKVDDNCWIANDVNILKGSDIPKNSVIAAMSLVNKKLIDSGVYVGIPAIYKRNI